jgi:CDP-diacylglycerol---glycerol-3-phosphate 3-phosphatidyltransferase
VLSGSRLTLPNIITLARIAVCPVLFLLAIATAPGARFAAFVLFVVAALSDVWDGYLARKHGWITDVGKLLDPLADKLLLVSTFVPFYIVSHRPGEENEVPFWGPLPLWVLLIIFGRELFITVFRQWAQRRGVVIAAGKSGKSKALFQSLFMAALLLWYPLLATALARAWTAHPAWPVWEWTHGAFIAATLLIALVLTVYSMIHYLWSYRSLVGVRD